MQILIKKYYVLWYILVTVKGMEENMIVQASLTTNYSAT